MSDVKMNQDLSILISDLTTIEQDKLMLMATIYTRKMNDIKIEKINKFSQYLTGQALYYNCNMDKYAPIIKNFEEIYKKEISRLLDQFGILYSYLQNEIVFAQTNQKIAVANFVASKRGMDKAKSDNNLVLIEKSNRKMFATAQKKLNYDVIIDECSNQLDECINTTINRVNEIFTISADKIAEVKTGFWNKIKHFFETKFNKNTFFEDRVLKSLENKIKIIQENVYMAVSEIKEEMLTDIAQLEKIRKDINYSFNETLNKVS